MSKIKKRKHSFSGLNLKPEEDLELTRLLETHDIKGKALIRALVRQWIAEGGEGILKYSKK